MHVDPGAVWFPHYLGYTDERGTAVGMHQNRNILLAPGTGDAGWLAAIEVLCMDVRTAGAEAIALSLGLDAAASDPESPLQVSVEDYRQAAERVASLGPAVVIQEGGYDLAVIGELLVAALAGVQAGQA